MSGDWKEVALGDLLAESAEARVAEPSDYPLLTVRLNGGGVEPAGKHPNKTRGGRPHYVRRQGQILIGRQNFHRGSAGAVPALGTEHVTSNAISAFDVKRGHDARFVLHLLQWPETRQRAASRAAGTGQQEISQSALLALPARIPELPEQQRIADLLEDADAVLIAQAGLVEARQRARAALLDSLLQVHSGTRKLSEVADVQLGKTISPREADLEPKYSYLRTANVLDGVVSTADLKQMHFSTADLAKYQIREGDVLVLEGGDAGRTALYVGRPMPYQNHIHRVRAKSGASSPQFLAMALEHAWRTGQLEALCGQTTIKTLPVGKLREFEIPCPPLTEQHRVADVLSAATAALRAGEATLAAMRSAREQLLHDLLSGNHRIPDSYDEIMEVKR